MNSKQNITDNNKRSKLVTYMDTASGDTQDNKSPIPKKIKINESGDGDSSLNTSFYDCKSVDDSSSFLSVNESLRSADNSLSFFSANESLISTSILEESTSTSDQSSSGDTTLESSTSTDQSSSRNTTLETSTSIDPSTSEDSSFDYVISKSAPKGTVTNSTLKKRQEDSFLRNTQSCAALNKTFRRLSPISSNDTSLDESLQRLVEEIGNLPDTEADDCGTTTYFPLKTSTSSAGPISFKDLNTLQEKDDPTYTSTKPKKLFKEYREHESNISSETSVSLIQPDESWMCDPVNTTKGEEEVKELEDMMSKLKVSSHNTTVELPDEKERSFELPDEKERSFERIEYLLDNTGDEFGADIETTNLLLLASQTLETYAEIEEEYSQREEVCRDIVRRRFNVTLENFFKTFGDDISIKEGLDRFEKFLEEVEKTATLRENCGKPNSPKFNWWQILKCVQQRRFQSEYEKLGYLKNSKYPAFHLHDAKVNKLLSKLRGYESV